jgi:alanyl-tRNA synthetase
MLGNFSFGNYFKKEAIPWAWELVTSPEWFGIPKDKLYVTIFGGGELVFIVDLPRDDEAYDCWRGLGLPTDRIFELGMRENFWQMGETGPCGPCSEIHYDMGAAASDLGHTDCKFPCDCGRFVELWNLVFMQFNRDDQGKMSPLPRPSIDTGAGLERLAAVLQGKLSNFDTDLFQPLIQEAAELAKVEYGANRETDVSMRIIADHARAATFLISDGVLPSNEGRGYVLRLIMRRALYHGQTLGLNEPFLYKMSGHVVDMMKGAYPELVESAHHIAKAIKIEEEKYAYTTRIGLDRLEETDLLQDEFVKETLDALPVTQNVGQFREFKFRDWKKRYSQGFFNPILGSMRSLRPLGRVPGPEVFRLHDTFGLRPDFVEDIVKNYGLTVDREGYEAEMQRQRERGRASWKVMEGGFFPARYSPVWGWYDKLPSFNPDTSPTELETRVVGILLGDDPAHTVQPGAIAEVFLYSSPFYPESGGQVGDLGELRDLDNQNVLGHVKDTKKVRTLFQSQLVHVLQQLKVGMPVLAVVDGERRNAIRRNHTATHLLHAALRTTLGPHVKQAGSLVAPDRLRFDFSHYAALGEQDLLDIEDLVNQHVLANEEMHTEVMDLDTAINTGAMALFGEKYGDKVRVVSVADGSFSKELCGGTHVHRTGDIGLFKVVSESSVAAGTRRIEALTGRGVLDYLRKASGTLAVLGETLRARPDELLQAAEKLTESEKKLRKQLEAQQLKQATSQAGDLLEFAKEVKGVRVISTRVEVTDRAAMRQMVDNLRPRLNSGVIVLGSVLDGKVSLIVAVTKDLTDRLDAGHIIKEAVAMVGGKGGGRKDLAEAGGTQPEKLDEALGAIPSIIEKML